MKELIKRAISFKERIAIKSNQTDHTYHQLLRASESVAIELLNGRQDLEEERVVFLVPASFDYVSIQWGIWRAGGIAVPLCEKHPLPSIEYVIEDTKASTIIFSKEFEGFLSPLLKNTQMRCLPLASIGDGEGALPEIDAQRRALILYTSGTTGNPKGVVTTHANIQTQIEVLTSSWQWRKEDHALNVLPLHHVHGIINILSCALWSGACCQFLPKFDAQLIFKLFCQHQINVFMAVPTIYFKLIAHYDTLPEAEKEQISSSLKKFRLMVSGSAALPVSVLEKWEKISGHTLLERYGMTEIGMAISNPYNGERRAGYIGTPLPGVSIRLADENNNIVASGSQGEIQIKGANVFKEYWGKPQETLNAFTPDGWFMSGDMAVVENGSYRILGRNSVDIIKSGGYKISALEIEEVMRSHPKIKDCGVVGIPDEEWGEIIVASLVLSTKDLDLSELKDWIKTRLPSYKLPRKYITQGDLPRNVMGKVTKKEIKKLFGDV